MAAVRAHGVLDNLRAGQPAIVKGLVVAVGHGECFEHWFSVVAAVHIRLIASARPAVKLSTNVIDSQVLQNLDEQLAKRLCVLCVSHFSQTRSNRALCAAATEVRHDLHDPR